MFFNFLDVKILILHKYKLRQNLYVHVCVHAKSPESCQTLCDPLDCSPPGPLSMIFLARMLEWVAVPSSRMYMYMQNIFTEQVQRFNFASNFLIITSISFLHFVYGYIQKTPAGNLQLILQNTGQCILLYLLDGFGRSRYHRLLLCDNISLQFNAGVYNLLGLINNIQC